MRTPGKLRRRGSAAVESVIVIPIYVLLLSGVVMAGHIQLASAQNAVAGRFTLWSGQGGTRSSDFIQGVVGEVSFNSGGRGKEASGEAGGVLDWRTIYGGMQLETPEFMPLMAEKDESGSGQGGVLHGYLELASSQATASTSSIIPFTGRFTGSGGSNVTVKAPIRDAQYVVVPKGKLPSETIRKIQLIAPGTVNEHPIDVTLGTQLGPARNH